MMMMIVSFIFKIVDLHQIMFDDVKLFDTRTH